MQITEARVRSILTRTTGFLATVTSHSLQPYRGCTFGRSLCGIGCYVQHNSLLTRGKPWGSFLEARTNGADRYREQYDSERSWARESRDRFGVFMSSSTDPFVPQEDQFRITQRVIEAMIELPPDLLIVQTHTHRVTLYTDLYSQLSQLCELRFHISIESDLDRLPGLPPPASSVAARLQAAAILKSAGLHVVITVSPLLPIQRPREFFERISKVADAVVIDHFIQGDGSAEGTRTFKTGLPPAMHNINPNSICLSYRDEIANIAREVMPGRVGVHIDGFAGRMLSRGADT